MVLWAQLQNDWIDHQFVACRLTPHVVKGDPAAEWALIDDVQTLKRTIAVHAAIVSCQLI
jgi:hypothetical protein